MMYSQLVLDHFEHPRNGGELPAANAVARIENPMCGDMLEVSLRLENGVIAEVRFRAKGCVPAIACASRLTEMVEGLTVADALRHPPRCDHRVAGRPSRGFTSCGTVGGRRAAGCDCRRPRIAGLPALQLRYYAVDHSQGRSICARIRAVVAWTVAVRSSEAESSATCGSIEPEYQRSYDILSHRYIVYSWRHMALATSWLTCCTSTFFLLSCSIGQHDLHTNWYER